MSELDFVMMGTNQNEGTVQAPMEYPDGLTPEDPLSVDQVHQTELNFFHDLPVNPTAEDFQMADEFYPPTEGANATADFIRDERFLYLTRAMLQELGEQGVPTYKYLFNYTRSDECRGYPANLGVVHGADAPFVFYNATLLEGVLGFASNCTSFEPEAQSLADIMTREWGSFLSEGRPTSVWPLYNNASNISLVFGTDSENPVTGSEGKLVGTVVNYQQEESDWFWDLYMNRVLPANQ